MTSSNGKRKGPKPTKERRAEIVASIGQQGQSRAEKFIASFMRDYLDLDPTEYIPAEGWDDSPSSHQYSKALTRGPKKEPQRILEKMTDGRIEDNKDNTRLTVIFKDASTIHKLRRLLPRFDQVSTDMTQQWAKKNVHLVEYEDNFYKSKKYGYRGFDLKFDLMIGKGRWARLEVKFLHEHMRETDRYTRALFTERRAIIDKAESEHRKLTPEEQRLVDANADMIRRVYELDILNPAYKLSGLEGPEVDIRHFEGKLEEAKEKGVGRKGRRLNTDKDHPINTPWHWELANFAPEDRPRSNNAHHYELLKEL
jgi:hypothetical protein